jgi:Glycolipid transfer protein (GLTP)
MAGIHTFVVRTAVKAGMYTLPTRENFLKSLGEAGDRPVRLRASYTALL